MNIFVNIFRVFCLVLFISACSDSSVGRKGGAALADFDCSGACTSKNLSMTDVENILKRAVGASNLKSAKATIAVTDRLGNVLAVFQMPGAKTVATIDGGISAVGGLEAKEVRTTLVAISKAGTGAFLSSQGNAFSTRTASHIIQEHFNPLEKSLPGGPLFGVQFSQLPCSDILIRNPSFADTRSSGGKPAATGLLGPRFLPLGLSADPGGFPLYKEGDLVGGVGIEVNGRYSLDRNIEDEDDDLEERLSLMASRGFEAPSKRVASNMNIGKSLRYSDLSYEDLESVDPVSSLDGAGFVSVAEFAGVEIREGATFGTTSSGVLKSNRNGIAVERLVNADGSERYPARAAANNLLSAVEVQAILDSAILVASHARAAIRRPLDSSARVNIWVVDSLGAPLGFIRSEDAPIFGIDVALQKARSAAFFSSSDAGSLLEVNGFSDYVSKSKSLVGTSALDGTYAYSNRAIGNLSRPFFPDGIDADSSGPLSRAFPGTSSDAKTWSVFNTGLQFELIETKLFEALGVLSSATFPEACSISGRLQNGMQIFPGAFPLYRGEQFVGAIGVSGDGVDQDDLIAFYSVSRKGLDEAGFTQIGTAELGFQAPIKMRSDQIALSRAGLRLRYVNCPEGPWVGAVAQNVCGGM